MSALGKKTNRFRVSCDNVENALTQCYKVQVAKSKGLDTIDGIVLPQQQVNIIKDVSEWLENKDGKERPWLLLLGYVGNGKTTLLMAIRMLIDALYGDNGQFAEELVIVKAKQVYEESLGLSAGLITPEAKSRLLAIDDLGVEPAGAKVYGNPVTPIAYIIYERYDARRFTILSSNLTPDELEEKYGERVYDRMREMCRTISFSGESFRKYGNE